MSQSILPYRTRNLGFREVKGIAKATQQRDSQCFDKDLEVSSSQTHAPSTRSLSEKNFDIKKIDSFCNHENWKQLLYTAFFVKFLLHKQYVFIIKKLEIMENQAEEIADRYISF